MVELRFLQPTIGRMRRRTALSASMRLMLLAALIVSPGYVTHLMGMTNIASAQDRLVLQEEQMEIPLGVVASPRQEVPSLDGPGGGGLGVFTINAERTAITYDFRFTGPFTSAPQQTQIHLAPIGVNGPPVFFVCETDQITPMPAPPGTPTCPGMEGGRLQGILRETDLIPQPNAGAATFQEALNVIISGGGYLNIRTFNHPSGEARGQMGQIGLGAILSSEPSSMMRREVNGLAKVSMPPERRAISYELTLEGPLTGPVLNAQIHAGSEDQTGPAIFNLCPVPSDATESCLPIEGGTLSGTLRDNDLVTQPIAGIHILADAIDALISGNAYFNVRTEANPDGEVRGQIEVAFSSTLSSEDAVPPVRTPSEATGSALLLLNRDRREVTYSLTLNGQFTGNVREVHVRVAPEGEVGPIAAYICARPSTDPPAGVPRDCPNQRGGSLNGTLTADDFIADRNMGPEDFEEFLAILARGDTYINVSTRRNSDGEIRGQNEPVQHMPDIPDMPDLLTFTEIQETIFVPFCTCHARSNPPLRLALNTDSTYDQLIDEPSVQRPALLRVEPGNPDNSYLIHKLEGGPNILGAQMPRGGPPLSQEIIDDVRAWIAAGALNN